MISAVFEPKRRFRFNKPLAVARGFHANQRRSSQLGVKRLGVPRGMHRFLFPGVPSLRVQPRHLLPAGMKITPYNHHAKAPSSSGALVLKPRLPGRSSLRSYPITSGGRALSSLLGDCSIRSFVGLERKHRFQKSDSRGGEPKTSDFYKHLDLQVPAFLRGQSVTGVQNALERVAIGNVFRMRQRVLNQCSI
jgi:hypothetical protein